MTEDDKVPVGWLERRLDNIDHQLEKLTDTMLKLASAEQQIVTIFRRQEQTDSRLNDLETRLRAVERGADGREPRVAWIERIVWVALMGLASVAAWSVREKLDGR